MTDTTTGKVAAQLSKNALWCDAFGQRFRDDSGGYQPGQFSPTGAQLIRHGKDFHDPDCSKDRESKMVEAAPGVHCDPCIAPIVAALNASGIATVASCCGHTRRPGVISLADGRELFIASDYLEARKIDAMFPVDINGEAAMTDTLEQRARGLLASEFPLADGFSAVLVRDMSIPQLGVVDTAIALRAIAAALQAQQPGAQAVVIPEPSDADVESALREHFIAVCRSNEEGTTGPKNVGMRAALTTDRARLRAEVEGLREQHGRDSAELRRLCAARDEQRDGRLYALERAVVAERERDAQRARAERAEGRIADAPAVKAMCAGLLTRLQRLSGDNPVARVILLPEDWPEIEELIASVNKIAQHEKEPT